MMKKRILIFAILLLAFVINYEVRAQFGYKACIITVISIDHVKYECDGQGSVCQNVLSCVSLSK